MRNATRALYNAYLSQVASVNGVPSATERFTVSAPIQQTLETRIQESSAFLKQINMPIVQDQSGEKIGIGMNAPIASTTNTAGGTPRKPIDPANIDGLGYFCTKTNFDSYIPYTRLDQWARFQDFETRIRDALLELQALDRIRIGLNGTSRAANSDRAANPMLQDVNKGWLQHYREQAPERVMKQGTTEANKIKVGAGGDYENLDALVFDLVNQMIDPWHAERTDLVVLVGRDLLNEKYFPIINKENAPTESLAAQVIVSQKQLGGLPAVRVPFMPAGTVFPTTLKNLSIYIQEESRRRSVIDNPAFDRVDNFESSNEAYVVEDFGAGAVAENIVIA